ncbi:TPA: hypothetical protein ACNUUK_000153 [Aeromonas salmonicida subsp. smithia]
MLRKVKCVKREVLVPLVRKPQGLTFQASPFGGRFFYLPRLYVSVKRNPGILPVGVDTRLIRAGAGRRQVGKPAIDYPIRALPEYVKRGAIGSPFCLWRYHSVPDQFSAIQASCQLVPIPGLFGLALADIQVLSRLSELAQFSAIQASCQLVPIPGLFGLALADIQVRSRLSELAQFSTIQASCQLVPIPGSYWVALADHWLHQPR